MNDEQARRLREPFPPSLIGKLPRGQIELDYVGHAVVTDRLLEVDPDWTWEPMGSDPIGRPVLIENVGGGPQEPLGLWGFITIAGVTRPAFGGGKNAKECISDLIRNGAMRFGVGLDLWSKEDLQAARELAGEEQGVPASLPASEPPVTASTDETPSPAGPWSDAELIAVRGAWDKWSVNALRDRILVQDSPERLLQMLKIERERETPRKTIINPIMQRIRELELLAQDLAGEPSPHDGASRADVSPGASESPAEDPDEAMHQAYEAFT